MVNPSQLCFTCNVIYFYCKGCLIAHWRRSHGQDIPVNVTLKSGTRKPNHLNQSRARSDNLLKHRSMSTFERLASYLSGSSQKSRIHHLIRRWRFLYKLKLSNDISNEINLFIDISWEQKMTW